MSESAKLGPREHPFPKRAAAIAAGRKVFVNDGGALVLQGESGNPALGVVCTESESGLIVILPTGPHTLDGAAVLLGEEQCEALAAIAGKQRAELQRRREAVPPEGRLTIGGAA